MPAADWLRKPTNLISVGVFALALVVYGFTLPATLSFWDCGEYITTSHILGIPHQPGTPLYVLVGRCFDIVLSPLMNTAQAVNFMSAFFSALAIMFIYLIIKDIGRRADPDASWLPHAGGVVGALFLLFSATYWNNAIEAEVYGLAAFMISCLTWLALRWYDISDTKHSNRLLYLVIYLLGLGVGFHLGTLLVYPGIFVLILLTGRRRLELFDLLALSFGLALFLLSTMINDDFVLTGGMIVLLSLAVVRSFSGKHFLLVSTGVFLLGLSVHLFMLTRAGLDPAINQSQPDNFATLMSVLRREQYPPIDPLVRKADLWWQIQYYYNYLLDQFTFLDLGSGHAGRLAVIFGPIFLGLLGMIHAVWRARPWAWMLLVNYLINADILNFYLNFSDHEVRERDYFFFAGFLFFAVFIGLGAAALLRYLAGPLGRAGRQLGPGDRPAPIRVKATVAVVAGLLIVLPALPLAPGHAKWFEHDRTDNAVAREYAWNLMAGLDPDSIVFTNGDNDTFPLWYLQEVEGFRRDVTVVNLALINLPWYIKQLKRADPPLPCSYTDEEVEKMRAIRYEDPDTGRQETIYVKDYMVHNIIEQSLGRRPVFFAVTIPQENMHRYFDMLQMEGLAYRFTGKRNADGLPSVDPDRMMANLYGLYGYSASLDGDDARRREEFERLNGIGIRGEDSDSRQLLGERTWRLDGLPELTGAHREDVYFDQNAENLLGNYPAGLIRAGYDYLLRAENTSSGEEAAYDELLAKSEAAFHLAAAFDPTFPMLTDLYPMVMITRGKADVAAAHMLRIHGRIPPEDEQTVVPQVLNSMLRYREFAAARSWMEGVIRESPDDPRGYLHLFNVHRLAGDVLGCREVMADWTSRFGAPNEEMASMLLELLESETSPDTGAGEEGS
ncbi:DUF2723 domain-containing protein [bacterium]|nr:DUF2723 domain-containing protein [bacterium]MBU1073670.1 DUF2723 domain-containing protein [bacterium]MBU1675325.1 DUF2723 domain-containing protein [bacterium]